MQKRWAALPIILSLSWLTVTLSTGSSEATAQTTGSVVINELLYHPAEDREDQEYVELTNTGPITVNVSGWWFSDGFNYHFPAGTLLPPGGYLVVARDPHAVAAEYGLDPAQLLGPFEAKWLSNSGERVALRDATGALVDTVTYWDHSPWPPGADGTGPSLELINPLFDDDQPCSWAASSGRGTPGAQNSVFAFDIPPCVEDVIHAPTFPAPGQNVTVTARIHDNGNLISTLVYHRQDAGILFDVAPLVDDGSGADASAGDGIYTAQLPPYADGSLVEFYVQAVDDGALTTRVPIGAPGTTSLETGAPLTIGYLFLVEETLPTASRPIYRLLVSDENWNELTTRDLYSNVLLDATFIQGDDVYYNVGLRYRGESSRPATPKSYRVNFPAAHPFGQVRRLNLVGDHIAREALTYDLFRRAGLVASETAFVDLYINAAYQALYITIEQVDEAFLASHLPGDDTGNLYRARDGGELSYRGPDPDDYRAYYLKQNNESADDYADIIALTDALTNSPEESFKAAAEAVADMAQWVRWFAINAVVFNTEGALFVGQGDDYFLYHRPSDDRFLLIPWDHDSTFYRATGNIWAPNLPIVKRILFHPPFTRKYLQNIAALTEHEFSAATMQPLIDALPPELDGDKDELKQFVTERIDFLTDYFASDVPDRPLAITTHGGESFTITQRIDTLTGECSPWRDVFVDGSAEGVVYDSIYDWQRALPPLRPGANRFTVRDRNWDGEVVTTRTITITYDAFDGGTLTENLTLTLAASPHIILEDIVVPPSLTLTVEPGATIAMAEGKSLFVQGQLVAEGTRERPILFTRDQENGYWGVVGLYHSSMDNRLAHVRLEYAGQAAYEGHLFSGLGVVGSGLTLEDSEVGHTTHTALDLISATVSLRRNWIHDTVDGAGLQAQNSFVTAEDNLLQRLYGGHGGIRLDGDGTHAGGALEHNVVQGVQGDCVSLNGVAVPVERNRLHHCTQAGISLHDTAGITLTNNLIYQSAVGVGVDGAAAPHLAHDTLAHNTTAGLAVYDASSHPTVLNSIVWGNGTSISYTAGSSVTISYSDVQGGWPGEGNLDVDPQFRHPEVGIFRLQQTSPCIGQATPEGAAQIDLLGIPRPVREHFEVGAFEFFEYHSVYLPSVVDNP